MGIEPDGVEPTAREIGPPRFAEQLLRQILPRGCVADSILGDLREEHAQLARRTSASRAARWYRRQLVGIGSRAAVDRLRGHGPFSTPRARRYDQHRSSAMIPGMLGALSYGAKRLARTPQFTLAAVVTLALAIGTNTAIFSVVQTVLLKPLPYDNAQNLVMLRHTAPGLGYDDIGISPGIYQAYRQSDALVSSGIFAEASVNLTGDDAPPGRVAAASASRDLFTTLGVKPEAGRIFDVKEDQPDGPLVVMLSYGLWQERFGGDRSIIGRAINVGGEPRTVVGIMPAGFAFPEKDTRLWMPLARDTTAVDYGSFSYNALGRVRADLDPAQVQATLRPLLARLSEDAGSDDFRAFMESGRLAPVVTPLKQTIVGDVSRPLWILLGTAALVFLIACANVTNLFLVRAETRQKEMAIRSALGGGRSSLVGHYAAESLLIAGAGGLLGLALSWAALRALLRIAPPNIPRLDEVAVDPLVLVFTALVTLLAALLLGILPTLRLTSPDLLATLSRSSRGASANRERNRARQTLVVAQTALALVLLVGSALMVRSFQNMRRIEMGFEKADALTFRLSLPGATYADIERVGLFHTQLLERLRALPGVEAVGASSHPPLAGCCSGTAHVIEDHPVETGKLPPILWYSTVSPGYFETMQIPLIAGTLFTATDGKAQNRKIVVSKALADRFWPDGNALGERLRLSSEDSVWYTITGVVGSVRDTDLEKVSEMIYYPIAADIHGQAYNMTYVLRSKQADALAPQARDAVWSVDRDLPIAASATYEKIVSDSMTQLSFTMLALVAASMIALILGAIGLYSVISYLVTQRTNEIGIRLALGARPGQVKGMIVLQGARLTVIGVLIGASAALLLTRLLQGILFGIEPNDPLTFVIVSGFLASVAILATYLPANRASAIDPASSLKAE